MMSEQTNTKFVQEAYAAFGRRDIEGLLGMMTETIDWHTLGVDELPMGGLRKGKPEVARFFKEVGDSWEFERFEPRQFVAQGDMVAVIGFSSGTSKGAGRRFSAEWVHVFTVRDGKVTRFREYTDTSELIGAFSAKTAGV
jgi:hypothetical protein